MRKLALLINTNGDWPYVITWLCEDSQHVLLSSAGHVSTMIDGTPSKSTCGWLSQLEVNKLLQSGSKVVYPEGLNGGLEPVWVPLLKTSIWEAWSTCKPISLTVVLPRTTHGDKPSITPSGPQCRFIPLLGHGVPE